MERRERKKKIHRKIDTSTPRGDSRENTAPSHQSGISYRTTRHSSRFLLLRWENREQPFTANISLRKSVSADSKTFFVYTFSVYCCEDIYQKNVIVYEVYVYLSFQSDCCNKDVRSQIFRLVYSQRTVSFEVLFSLEISCTHRCMAKKLRFERR